MSYSNFNSPQLAPPQQHKFIPPNKFIAIDEKYYQKKEDIHPRANEVFGRQGRPLQPHGTNVNHATPLIPQPLGLSGKNLKVNYLSYIYNQQIGFDSAHPR